MKRPEQALHFGVARFLNMALPSDALWWHTPNGGARTKAEAGIFKALGTLAGFPDIAILWRGMFRTIELKPRGRYLSAAQRELEPRIVRAGGDYAICHDLDEVVATLDGWGIPLNARIMGGTVGTARAA